MYPSAPSSPAPSPEGGRRAVVLSLTNQKGGVGKTTTAVNLGACLADAGAKVLLIDLDPQGNATTGVGVDRAEVKAGAYEVLTGAPIAAAIRPTEIDNLSLVPSTIDLAGAEVELVSAFAREMKLRQAISAVQGEYDYVLIDSPPSLGLLAVNALAAADHVVVPIQCEYYALEGLSQLMRTLNLIREGLNPALTVGGVVLTMFDARTKLAEQVVAEVRKFFGDVVFRNLIPRSVRLSEAPGYGKPIILYAPGSRAALAYKDLAAEALARWTPALAPTFRKPAAHADQEALPLGDLDQGSVAPLEVAGAPTADDGPPASSQQQVTIPLPEGAEGWTSLLTEETAPANGAREGADDAGSDAPSLEAVTLGEPQGAAEAPTVDVEHMSHAESTPQQVVADPEPQAVEAGTNANFATLASPQDDPVVDASVDDDGARSEAAEEGGEPELVPPIPVPATEPNGNDSQRAAPAWPPWVAAGSARSTEAPVLDGAEAPDGERNDGDVHQVDPTGDERAPDDEDVR